MSDQNKLTKYSDSELLEELRQRNYALSVWSVDDVLYIDPKLTEEQAIEVINNIEKRHDKNHGINWYTLSRYIDELYN